MGWPVLQSSGETLRWEFDFSSLLVEGDTLTGTPTATATEGATIGTVALASPSVSVDVSGIPFGRVSRVVCTCSTTNGETLTKQATIRGAQR